VAVSNLAETESGSQPVNLLYEGSASTISFAQSFTTGGDAVYLNFITLQMTSGGYGSGFTVTLHEREMEGEMDVPGEFLAQLAGSGTPAESGAYNFSATEQILLSADTTYFWMAWIQPDGGEVDAQFNVSTTGSMDETSDAGWSLGDAGLIYEGTEEGEGEWISMGEAALFSVNTTAIPEPGTYGALVGIVILGIAASRRRA